MIEGRRYAPPAPLDRLFQYETRILTLFYGDTGSGKTTLAVHLPIAIISKEGLQDNDVFVIVDTERGVSPARLSQILKAYGLEPREVFKHIKYYTTAQFNEQHKLITQLIPKLAKEHKWRIRLIALDSAVAIYRGIVIRTDPKFAATTIRSYTGKIDLQLQTMIELALEHDAVATVTSWPTSVLTEAFDMPEEVPMIGGRGLGFWSKCIIELRLQEGNRARAIIYKHREKPRGLYVDFQFCDSGVSP